MKIVACLVCPKLYLAMRILIGLCIAWLVCSEQQQIRLLLIVQGACAISYSGVDGPTPK